MTENKIVSLKPDFEKMTGLLADLSEALSESRHTNAFQQRLLDLVDVSLFEKLFTLESHPSACATEILVTAEPTELFNKILSALRAGDFDLSVFAD